MKINSNVSFLLVGLLCSLPILAQPLGNESPGPWTALVRRTFRAREAAVTVHADHRLQFAVKKPIPAHRALAVSALLLGTEGAVGHRPGFGAARDFGIWPPFQLAGLNILDSTRP